MTYRPTWAEMLQIVMICNIILLVNKYTFRNFFKIPTSGLQEQAQSFWAHCVMVEQKKAETWTSCHLGRGTGRCTVRPNYKNPPEIRLKKTLKNWLITLISATVWQNRKRKSWMLLWKIREITLKLKWMYFWRGFAIWNHCALVQLELNDRASYRARTLLKNLVVAFWKAQTDRQDSWLVFPKENTVCFIVKTVWFILSNWR